MYPISVSIKNEQLLLLTLNHQVHLDGHSHVRISKPYKIVNTDRVEIITEITEIESDYEMGPQGVQPPRPARVRGQRPSQMARTEVHTRQTRRRPHRVTGDGAQGTDDRQPLLS